ncbi:hypothetical protein, partial [Endozoicomonas sp. ONNA2]|uniref:hypothetical protein n=1 Tax=Endozoicomonas sp. ONNA2 TaxID=2828741 RepID=UPI0021479327
MPIPLADYVAHPSTSDSTRASHGPQKRQGKRSRSGYQVGQTTGTPSILPKHQQPPEPPFAPPIKLRRVHDGRRVVSSFGEQPAQETEPIITVNTEPLPIAVARAESENPQPTSEHILSTTSETTPTQVR